MGVHHTTVSLALRDSPLLKDETKEKIQAKAKEMNYRPNLLAQGFRSRSYKAIGLMVPSIHHHFFSKFISEITELASQAGYSVIVMQSNEKFETERMNIDSLLDSRIAGLIASISLETQDSNHFEIFTQEKVPLVFFDRIPNGFQGTTVTTNNYQLAYDAVEHMILKGRRVIAFITGNSQINVFNERIRGYKAALKNHNLPVDNNLIIESGFEILTGAKSAEKLISHQKKPDGILAVNDRVAMGAIRFLKKQGFNIPEDISVVGFDNDPMGMAVEPELTTCRQPIEKLAEASFNAIMDQIETGNISEMNWIFDGELMMRGSF